MSDYDEVLAEDCDHCSCFGSGYPCCRCGEWEEGDDGSIFKPDEEEEL